MAAVRNSISHWAAAARREQTRCGPLAIRRWAPQRRFRRRAQACSHRHLWLQAGHFVRFLTRYVHACPPCRRNGMLCDQRERTGCSADGSAHGPQSRNSWARAGRSGATDASGQRRAATGPPARGRTSGGQIRPDVVMVASDGHKRPRADTATTGRAVSKRNGPRPVPGRHLRLRRRRPPAWPGMRRLPFLPEIGVLGHV